MAAQKYEFQVTSAACYESLSCDQVVTILNQTSFDMKDCTYQEGFLKSGKKIISIDFEILIYVISFSKFSYKIVTISTIIPEMSCRLHHIYRNSAEFFFL